VEKANEAGVLVFSIDDSPAGGKVARLHPLDDTARDTDTLAEFRRSHAPLHPRRPDHRCENPKGIAGGGRYGLDFLHDVDPWMNPCGGLLPLYVQDCSGSTRIPMMNYI
jgi:hypothetical protein